MKTIAQLTDESSAADKAYDAAQSRREALSELARAIDTLDALRSNRWLLPSDVKDINEMNLAGAWLRVVAARKAMRPEIDRLGDVLSAAQRALSEAPEDAA